MNTISFFGFAYRVEREPQGTQRQARSSRRTLSELRENPYLQVYQTRGMAGRLVAIYGKKIRLSYPNVLIMA